MRKLTLLVFIILLTSFSFPQEIKDPAIKYNPRSYICYRSSGSIKIDGKLDEKIWSKAPWTNNFVDIRGEKYPEPRFDTRAKMLWDDEYFYIGAKIDEPDIWATLTNRDAVIYHDNDFEVFIDPNGDTHNYSELEMNALNTVWDLLILKPYRDGNTAINGWDIHGLKTAVYADGSINDPLHKDNYWSVEIAIPWNALKEIAGTKTPPLSGDQWKVNFSRVEWKTDIKNGKYERQIGPVTGKILPEDNWVWSPQGLINMHYPEMWGLVQFSDKIAGRGIDSFKNDPYKNIKWILREVYYKQRKYFLQNKKYASTLKELIHSEKLQVPNGININFGTTLNLYEAWIKTDDGNEIISIDEEGKLRIRKNPK